MRKGILIPLLVMILPIVFAACSSELNDKNDLPASPTLDGVHADGYIIFASPDFHGKVIAGKNWDMSECRQCHGTDYSGGLAGQSCNASGCHAAADGGPEACYTCHGDRITKKDFPHEHPFHKTHLEGGVKSATTVACTNCHDLPSSLNDPAHFGGANPSGAEVNLKDPLASTQTKGTTGTPAYDPSSGTCSNVYCHGNFTNGNNFAPKWNGSKQSACGTCHGDAATGNPLPKAPHAQVQNCAGCHADVVDANRNIIDRSKHINGKLNVFNQERTNW